ncbi:hypothetical protein GE061_001899, partial [Apolygus lucorum]
MANVDYKELSCCLFLALVCVYNFTATHDKYWATIGHFLFLATGGLGSAVVITGNADLKNIYNYAYFGSQTAGVDFLMVDICMMFGVSGHMALLNLVPPLLGK